MTAATLTRFSLRPVLYNGAFFIIDTPGVEIGGYALPKKDPAP